MDKEDYTALAGGAQGTERWPADQKVAGSIPSQGTCLGGGPGPPAGGVREGTDRCFSCTSVFLSLSFSPPSKNK